MLYQLASSVTISATDGGSNNPLLLVGSQALIDATGKAQDVLKRVQVRTPLTPSSGIPSYPDYALETTDSICKRFQVTNTAFIIPSDIDSTDPNAPLCQPTIITQNCSIPGHTDLSKTDPNCAYCPYAGLGNLWIKDPKCVKPTGCLQPNRTVAVPFNRIGYKEVAKLVSGYETTFTLATPVPAGCYFLSLYTTDDHHWGNNNAGADFMHEQWHATFYDSKGNFLYKSADVADLPDHCKTGYQTVNAGSGPQTFTADIKKIVVDHIEPWTQKEADDYANGIIDDNSMIPQKIVFTQTNQSSGFKCTVNAPPTKPK
jgi:hypothetical protein